MDLARPEWDIGQSRDYQDNPEIERYRNVFFFVVVVRASSSSLSALRSPRVVGASETVHSQLALRVGAADWKQVRNAEKS
jgi:hypothetical protein